MVRHEPPGEIGGGNGNPNGVVLSPAQGWRVSAYLGARKERESTPTGLRRTLRVGGNESGRNRVAVGTFKGTFTQGSSRLATLGLAESRWDSADRPTPRR